MIKQRNSWVYVSMDTLTKCLLRLRFSKVVRNPWWENQRVFVSLDNLIIEMSGQLQKIQTLVSGLRRTCAWSMPLGGMKSCLSRLPFSSLNSWSKTDITVLCAVYILHSFSSGLTLTQLLDGQNHKAA
mmetsp:Transcript_32760/g.79302  ORF Transcript_32760/g.79302 Transcript_32760/m.79302 type:complete len:128 (+) Transcript_32760:963-1346(+)